MFSDFSARCTTAALLLSSAFAATALAGVYDTQSTELLQEYGSAVDIEDIDEDGVITDMDFSIWVVDRVFAQPVPDYDQDGDIDVEDGVLALASELTGLAADFDNSDAVDDDDILRVIDNLGDESGSAASGDLNADAVVDAQDIAAATEKYGTVPALDPVDVAIELLHPLINFDPATLSIDSDLVGDPPPGDGGHDGDGDGDGGDGPIEYCGSATCKAVCRQSSTGKKWTYRLFMLGFCGSQFEAQNCCSMATAAACECSPDGFEFDCWLLSQGTYVACLLSVPD